MDEPVILAASDELWALSKPAGMPVHRTAEGQPDLISWAIAHGAPASLAPAHRLDAATSGVLLASPDPEVRARLGQWFEAGEIHKTYLAVVHGKARAKGTINRPLQDRRRGRALPARTRFVRLEKLGGFTLLEVRPETGRAHQIRRHLHGIGLSIVGDERYRRKRFRAVPGFPGRLWLHAAKLELPDGRVFEAPLPPELEAHLALLRAGAAGE